MQSASNGKPSLALQRRGLSHHRCAPRAWIVFPSAECGLARSRDTGMCDLTWPGADRMLCAEAVRRQIPVCLSLAASTSLGDTRAAAGDRAWFQVHVGESVDAALSMIDRAEAAGYEFLILTVDVPQVGRRIRELRSGFRLPFRLGARQLVDIACHPR